MKTCGKCDRRAHFRINYTYVPLKGSHPNGNGVQLRCGKCLDEYLGFVGTPFSIWEAIKEKDDGTMG